MAPKVFLRVNGIDIPKAWVRSSLERGAPCGRPEVVIEVPSSQYLPSLGEITLDPEFNIEVMTCDKDWSTVSVMELVNLLSGKADG